MNLRKKITPVALVLGIAVPAIAITTWWYRYYNQSANVELVTRGDLESAVIVSGAIRYTQRAAVASEGMAAVALLPVGEGERVTKGQPLVILDDSVLAAECVKAQARVELASQQLGELEAGPRKEQVAQAKETVNRAQADLTFAQKEYGRLEPLHNRKLASESEFNLAANRLDKAKADLAWSQASLDLLVAGARTEEIARARAEVALARADLNRSEALRRKHIIRAPYDAVVTARMLNIGEVVSSGQVLLHVGNIDDVEIRAQVQEGQLPGVRSGSRARVLADAYPHTPLEAVVEKVLPRVDRGAVTVVLKLARKSEVLLMDGMAADIAIIDCAAKDVIRVRRSAVETEGPRTYVWVRQKGAFVRRQITLGITGQEWAEVKSGMEAGDRVRLP